MAFETKKTNIAVAGIGYVGLSNAVLLARHNSVTAVDIVKKKVDMLNGGLSPVHDREAQRLLSSGKLYLKATDDAAYAYSNADFIIISTPTNYDPEKNFFDTSSVESVYRQAREASKSAAIVIKSTVPIGFTDSLREKYGDDCILFSPEFLREGQAVRDNLFPSRIIVSSSKDERLATRFADLMQKGALGENIPVMIMPAAEAESVKLFANTYLAMRVAFFNELDTYAEMNSLDSRRIIEGVGFDSRIGMYYNNPSFGYGGYCLPKDTKQLASNYSDVPNDIITSIVSANKTRKEYITRQILQKTHGTIGIYRLTMKIDSDNFRHSAILGVLRRLKEAGRDAVIYEPSLNDETFWDFEVIKDIGEFKRASDIIVANRTSAELSDVMHKVYSRDIFSRD
jgi:UDPglucose 6-dehydrogenase